MQRLRNEQGQTATEFAIVLPVLCLVLFGVIQFGMLFNNYVTLTDATRVGARKAAVSRRAVDPVGDTTAAVRKAAQDLKQSDLTVSVTTPSGWTAGADVKVSASYPYSIDLLGLVVASGQLRTTTTERVE